MKLSIAEGVHLVEPGDFEPKEHWYPRVLNSNIHPLVNYFLNLNNEQIASRYCRLNPFANKSKVLELLQYKPQFFQWSGTDIMHVTNKEGRRKLTIIETNSCPSGQKSMPILDFNMEKGGYNKLITLTFKPLVDLHKESGVLAVLYDKNPMENIGYASTVAEVFNEDVYLVQYKNGDTEASAKFENNKLFILGEGSSWIPVRAAFRYVTQEPWNRIPLKSKTLLLNPIEACLAGGRNKAEASKAYEKFNLENKSSGLILDIPKTYTGVTYQELPQFFEKMKNSMVIKVPDSNAGQGVYVVTSEKEFIDACEELKPFNQSTFIVQQLIFSNYIEGSDEVHSFYHVGTLPDNKNRSYAFDIRMMMHYTSDGLRPLAVYSRKARLPLNQPLPEWAVSWDVYGTNLSVKEEDGWSYEDDRLLLYDIRNFGRLGLGVDELIQAFVQSCMATIAVDQHAKTMFNN